VIFYLTQRKLDLYLPNNWLWEMNHLIKEVYKQSNTDPVYYFKDVDNREHQEGMWVSQEYQLFEYLKELLEFENIPISKVTALSCITLATNMSGYRKLITERFKSSSSIFLSKSWEREEPIDLRLRVRDHYRRQIMQFDWNRNLKLIEDCPVLAVVHGTNLKKAQKIISTGFASLSTTDKGFYGKGIYFSSYAIYTIPYFMYHSDPCILICYVLPGNPYPVTENPRAQKNLEGEPLQSGYQSNFVITRKDGLPFTETDYDEHRKYDEIVITQESQVVPIFLVEVDTNVNLNKLRDQYQREIIHPENDDTGSDGEGIERKNDIIHDEDSHTVSDEHQDHLGSSFPLEVREPLLHSNQKD